MPVLKKGPLKKGEVRQALDKRIEAARRASAALDEEKLDPNIPAVIKRHAELKSKESILQSVRNELFGERLAKPSKKSK